MSELCAMHSLLRGLGQDGHRVGGGRGFSSCASWNVPVWPDVARVANCVTGTGAAGRYSKGARRLEGVASDLSGPANLWIAGILDDAERDARSHQPGSVLDVALVGAVRKAKAAEAVSSETAIALARASGAAAIGEAAAANHAEEVATDGALRDLLDALTR